MTEETTNTQEELEQVETPGLDSELETAETVVDEDKSLIDKLQDQIKALNKENKDRRIKNKELEEYKNTQELNELEEIDKLKKQLENANAAKTQFETLVVDNAKQIAIKAQADKLFADPQLAVDLLKLDTSIVYNEETNSVDGVEEALKNLIKKYPNLKKGTVTTPTDEVEPDKSTIDDKTKPTHLQLKEAMESGNVTRLRDIMSRM